MTAKKPLTMRDYVKPKQPKKPKPAPSMNLHDMIEQLADAEHAGWSRWQAYLHSLCERDVDGTLVIPAERVERWQRQIDAPYADLSEEEKESDRDEVRRILPIIRRYAENPTGEPQTFPVQIALVLMVDGEPKHNATCDMQGTLPPDGATLQLVMAADARQLAQLVEQVLGPQSRPSGLWTPGQGGGPVVLAKKD